MGLRFYSRLPTGSRPHLKPDLSRIALALPFTSLVIALGPAALLLCLEWLAVPHYFAAALAVAAQVIVTGAMAEDALADAADGLFGGHTAERRLEIMKDSRHGTFGVVAIVLLIALRITAVGSVAHPLAAAGIFVAASLMARSGALWLTIALPPARAEGRLGRRRPGVAPELWGRRGVHGRAELLPRRLCRQRGRAGPRLCGGRPRHLGLDHPLPAIGRRPDRRSHRRAAVAP